MTMNVEALNEVGRVFDWRPDPARYFATTGTERVRQALLTELLNTPEAHQVLLLAGAAGAGKTLLVGTVVQNLPAHWLHIAQLNFTVMSGQEIASAIAYALGMPPGPSVMSHQSPRDWIETQLRVWANGGEASLLVVDEAQNLQPDALQVLLELNQLRLHDRPVLRVLLVGQPEFLQGLRTAEGSPEHPAHDIGPTFWVPALTADESTAYIQQRLAQYAGPALPHLTPSAFTEIHARTQGLPGRINVLCQQLLHSAILLESYEPIDAAAVALQADELLYHAAVQTGPGPQALPPANSAKALPPTAPPPQPPPPPAALPPAAPTSLAPTLPTPSAAPAEQPRPVRHEAPRKPVHIRRLAAWSTGLIAIALVAGLTWFYTPQTPIPASPAVAVASPPAPTPTAAATPVAAPVTPAEPVADTAIATETTETPDPQTEALLSEQAAPAALPAPAPASPLPKETPHASLVTPPPPTITTTPAPAVAAPKPSRPVKPGPSARCTNLLAQMSLGEPLTAKQRLVLETHCRQTK